MVKGVLLDLSGVLHIGDRLLPGADVALKRLRASGLPLRFVTNTSRSTRRSVAARLQRLGLMVVEDEVFTAPLAARAHMQAHQLTPLLIIHPDIREEFSEISEAEPNAVLLGDAGESLDYGQLNAAFRLIMAGAPLFAMGRNRYFMDETGLNLDAGPFVAALEYATRVSATVLGKPATTFYGAAIAALGCHAHEAVMVGDDLEADVLGAAAVGMQALLVRTGKFRPHDAGAVDGRQTRVVEDFTAAVEWILAQ